jgi:hypothetical protein
MRCSEPTTKENMNHFKTLACTAALACSAWVQAADVGVSVQVSQPGVYGRIDIGRFPQPALVVAQPVIIVRPVRVVQAPPEPVYMWVPPGHRKNWRKHCSRYGACGVPVYFVQDRWYGEHVHADRRDWRDDQGHRHGHGNGNANGNWKGHGNGHGKGHRD